MKIFVLTIVIFALNGYVTRASSLDPTETFEMDDTMNNDKEDTRNKRSGSIFSSLMNKKLKLLGSLSGSSSSKSIGHSEHFEQPPLSFHTKSFDLWGVKKAIFSSVLQAAKAITGGVIALKGQLIKAKGHMVVAKGKLLQTKGQAISNFGQTIATHAFDAHQEHPPPTPHHYDAHSSVGLYNHLPATPVHQPTSYGAPSAVGYQEQGYSNNAYQQDTGYQGYPRYPTAPASTGYEGGAQDYSGLGGGNSYSAKRAVQNDGHKLPMNQLTSALDKDTVRAGLLLFKPIKLPQTQGGSSSAFQSSGLEHLFSQQPVESGKIFPVQDYKTPASQEAISLPNPFPRFQGTPVQSGGGYSSYQVPTYMTQQTTGYLPPAADYSQFPPNGAGGSSDSGERMSVSPNDHNGYGFQEYKSQESAAGQEISSQAGGFSGHQLPSFSQENGYDQNESASMSHERDAQATYMVSRSAENPRKPKPSNAAAAFTRSERFVTDFFLPTTPAHNNDRPNYSKKRSVAKNDEPAALASDEFASIEPLKYDSGSSSAAEEQAKLKQTVQRFFSILQQQR